MSAPQRDEPRDYPDGRPLAEQPQWRQDFPTDVPEDDYVSRREFTKFLVLTSGAFFAGQCWIAASSAFRRVGPFPEMRIGRLDEIPLGGVWEFRYPDEHEPCVLIRLAADRVVAFGQKCSHLACAVIPRPEKGDIHCPCHNGYFEIEHGRPIAGPPTRPLPLVQLEIRDGVVYAVGWELRAV